MLTFQQQGMPNATYIQQCPGIGHIWITKCSNSKLPIDPQKHCDAFTTSPSLALNDFRDHFSVTRAPRMFERSRCVIQQPRCIGPTLYAMSDHSSEQMRFLSQRLVQTSEHRFKHRGEQLSFGNRNKATP